MFFTLHAFLNTDNEQIYVKKKIVSFYTIILAYDCNLKLY